MKLSEKAIALINTPDVRRELSGTLKCTEQTIIRYIKGNEDNGPLTTVGALQVIKDMTAIKDSQLFYKEPAGATK